MKGIIDDMTPAEKVTLDRGRLHREVTNKLFYADDTIIMTSSAQASQLIFQQIQHKSKTYGMNLNQNRCEHIRLTPFIEYNSKTGKKSQPHKRLHT